MKVKYLAKRDTHRRILDQVAIKNLGMGLTLTEPLVFEAANGFTLEMDDGACDTLVKKLPEEFALLETPAEPEPVTEDAGYPLPDVDSIEASEADSEGSPDESEAPAVRKATRSSHRAKPKR